MNPLSERKKVLDDKMKGMIREVLFYIVFLFLLLAVIDGQQDNSSYQQNQNLAYSMTSPGLSNVVSGGKHVDKKIIWTEQTWLKLITYIRGLITKRI